MRVGVIGIGSIGSVLAYGLDRLGHEVAVNDIRETTARRNKHPVYDKPRLADWADSILVAVPTPTDPDRGGVTDYVEDALQDLHASGPPDATIILRSTMPPGSTRRLAETHSSPLVYSPEFLRDRSGAADFFNPDRIVLAGPQPARRRAKDVLTKGLGSQRAAAQIIETDDYITAELGKLAHNAFFATKVSFANQMRLIADHANASPEQVLDIVTADSRNSASHLDPRLGPYAGECLPKDLAALRHYAQTIGAPDDQLAATRRVNDHAQERYTQVDIADVPDAPDPRRQPTAEADQ